MLIGKPLPFVTEYVEKLSAGLEQKQRKAGLTHGQKAWLTFCIMCIIVTESVCWRKYVRVGLGQYSEALLSSYFRCNMTWNLLTAISIRIVLESFGTYEGILVIDDSGKKRSKVTKNIPYVHYYKDKEGTGTIRGQETVFLVLVTPLITIPVGYEFYQPDPAYTEWAKEEKRLKKLKTPNSLRPKKPVSNPDYPTKQQIALNLLEQFCRDCPYVTVKLVLADALYGTADFMDKAALITTQNQVISQLHHNQKVSDKRREWNLDEYFKAYPGVPKDIPVRGGKTERMIIGSARLYVEAHGCMRFVIAVRYPKEEKYRYLVASDLSWRTDDIMKAYTIRWLVETVIEDLKVYGGWGKATKQPGVEGSRRVLILSLLRDHCLILHPKQQARAAAREPLYTIGSLQRHLKLEAFIVWLDEWLEGEGLNDKIVQLTEAILPLAPLQKSTKHMSGRDLGRLEPTPGLQYRVQDLEGCVS
jgi:hypothetical protein